MKPKPISPEDKNASRYEGQQQDYRKE